MVERYFGDLSWNRQKRRIVQEVDDVEESRPRLISLRKSGKSFRTGANPRFTLEGYIPTSGKALFPTTWNFEVRRLEPSVVVIFFVFVFGEGRLAEVLEVPRDEALFVQNNRQHGDTQESAGKPGLCQSSQGGLRHYLGDGQIRWGRSFYIPDGYGSWLGGRGITNFSIHRGKRKGATRPIDRDEWKQ